MQRESLEYPVVLKPDVGERGRDVAVIRNDPELDRYLATQPHDTIAQEYVGGDEFGVFYIRHPSAERGQLFSIVEKRMLFVTGDGSRTLEEADPG